MARMMSTKVMAPMVPAAAAGAEQSHTCEDKARNHRCSEVKAANRCMRAVQADFASVTSVCSGFLLLCFEFLLGAALLL